MYLDLMGKFVSVKRMILYSICESCLNPCPQREIARIN